MNSGFLEMLRAEKDAGGADLNVFAEISKSEESCYIRMREFIRCAPKYDGNPKKVLRFGTSIP